MGTVGWLILTVYYLERPFLLDHVEANLVSVAWAYGKGLPLYHDLASSDRYTLLYGPLSFLANTAVLSLCGPSLLSAKLLGPITTLGSLVLIDGIARRWIAPHQRLLLVLLLCTCLLPHTFLTMSSRPDGLMMFLSASALVTALPLLEGRRLSWSRTFLGGLCVGLAASCKCHGFVYFLPIAGALLARRAFTRLLVALTASLLVALVFFLLDGVSAMSYLGLIGMATRHPLRWDEFTDILTWQLLASLPLLLGAARLSAKDATARGFSLGLAAAGVLLLGIAAKAGAGRHHILPLLPSYAVLMAWVWRQGVAWPKLSAAFSAASLVVTVGFGIEVAAEMIARSERVPARAIIAELDGFYRSVAARDGMVGYSTSYDLANFRVLNVFSGARPFVEEAAETDFWAAGQAPSPAVFRRLRRCPYAYWLIPKDEEPFYPKSHTPFAPEFHASFVAAYERRASMRYYDVWTCRAQSLVLLTAY